MSEQSNSYPQYSSAPQSHPQVSANSGSRSKFNFFDKANTNQAEQHATLNLSSGGLQKIFNTLNKQQ